MNRVTCKKLEIQIEILKTTYEKLWLALIATVGGLGTLLLKDFHKYTWLLLISSGLLVLEIIALWGIYLLISALAERLGNCEEDTYGSNK